MPTNAINFLLSAVVSADNFIADEKGQISFASQADSHLLKDLMRGDECDCFIVGRKTFTEMHGNIPKPYIILSHQSSNYKDKENKIYTNTNNFMNILKEYNLNKPLILGGATIYSYFLQRDFIIESRITVEENITLLRGIPWPQVSLGEIIERKKIANHTTSLRYKKG